VSAQNRAAGNFPDNGFDVETFKQQNRSKYRPTSAPRYNGY
jgi:hypothetical protein